MAAPLFLRLDGDLNMDMANIAKVVLFISACASLFGLMVFLFRDQIFSQMGADGEDHKTLRPR
jgi:hypothetical protein